MPIKSEAVFDSWNFPMVVYGTESALANYSIVNTLGFRNGTFIQSLATGKFYIIVDRLRRHIVSTDVLHRLCLNRNYAVLASEDEENLHKLGDDIK